MHSIDTHFAKPLMVIGALASRLAPNPSHAQTCDELTAAAAIRELVGTVRFHEHRDRAARAQNEQRKQVVFAASLAELEPA